MRVMLKMEGLIGFRFFVGVIFFGIFVGCGWSLENAADSATAVYIVTLRKAPISHFYGELNLKNQYHSRNGGSERVSRFDKPSNISHINRMNGSYVSQMHDSLLRRVLRREKYLKVYNYHYLLNGFAVLVTPQ